MRSKAYLSEKNQEKIQRIKTDRLKYLDTNTNVCDADLAASAWFSAASSCKQKCSLHPSKGIQ